MGNLNGISGFGITEADYETAIIEHLKSLGYEYRYGPDIRRTNNSYSDVFIENSLESSLRRVNPGIQASALRELQKKIKEVNGSDLFAKNKLFTQYLQSGVSLTYFDGKEQVSKLFKLLDFEHPEKNEFMVVNQWSYQEYETKRPDIVLFINGMPLVVFELKSPSRENVNSSDAYLQIQNYLNVIPSFFVPNVFVVLSDLADTRVGSITSPEDRFVQWKSADGNYEKTRFANYHTMLDGMCEKTRLLDIIRNFVCFDESSEKLVKIVSAYHQYFAVKKAIESTIKATQSDGKAGVFWHTQGSGKSLSMVFFAHLIQQKIDSPTIIVLTDRTGLDDQLFNQFSRCREFLRQNPMQATSRQNLIDLLKDRQANGIIFTTMQKFTEGEGILSDRRNIVVMADEAHRSQYGVLRELKNGKLVIGAAGRIREALPHASFIGFTGTPISTKDKDTKEIFGDYIDIYDMTQSVEDGATCPVYYESRVVSLKLDQDALAKIDELYQKEEDAKNEIVVERSKRENAALDSILGAPETIASLAEDIVEHYESYRQNLLSGKALVVAYSRAIAIRLYKEFLDIRPEWKEKIAVVMTGSNQDPPEWHDIIGSPQAKQDLARRFKDDNDPLKIAIVVDMWLTGFDVPSLSTMYVFKPMKGHNLMQAIARVNRVCKEKEGGLVVDYIGIANALKRAMNEYTNRDRSKYGDMDIGKTAYPEFQNHLSACRDYLIKVDYLPPLLEEDKNRKEGKDKKEAKEKIMRALLDASEILLDPKKEEDCRRFCAASKLMAQALSLAKSRATETEQLEASFIKAVRAVVIKRLIPVKDDKDARSSLKQLNERVSEIIQQSVKSEGVLNLFEGKDIDFSLFDESFLKEVAALKHKNIAVEILRRLLEGKIKDYSRKNLTQSEKFSEMFKRSLNGYLNGLLTNAEVFEEMVNIAHEIMKDIDASKALGLSEDEMAFYDALSKPQAVRDFYQNEELISLTKELTDTLRKNRTIDWQKKESARANMRSLIKRLLRKYKYPPEDAPDATDIIMRQCELWADTQIF
jgi:type I restriction enzyme R subunit